MISRLNHSTLHLCICSNSYSNIPIFRFDQDEVIDAPSHAELNILRPQDHLNPEICPQAFRW